MIKYVTGNLFDSNAEVLVNTVNCHGVMGKGIAYQFKERYPDMFEAYKEECDKGRMVIGEVHYYKNGPRKIVNFPTKDHWRGKSKLSYITEGLHSLKDLIIKENIESIAIPPLGAGNGGLPWNDVKKEIENILGDIAQTEILVYEPSKGVANTAPPKISYEVMELLRIAIKLESYTKESIQLVIDTMKYVYNYHFDLDKIDEGFNQIKVMKDHYGIKDNKEFYDTLLKRSISESLEKKLEKSNSIIDESIRLIENKTKDFMKSVIKKMREIQMGPVKYQENPEDNFIITVPGYTLNIFGVIEYRNE